MKTKEEILSYHRMNEPGYKTCSLSAAYDAMEEYAQQSIAEHDKAKWKKYPENKPDKITTYLTTTETTFQSKSSDTANLISVKSRFVSEQLWMGSRFNGNVIAFRELPKSYEEKSNG